MIQSVAEMRLALRVLAAITERRQPEPKDLEELRRIEPDGNFQSIDEIACAVIERAIDPAKSRIAAKAAHGEQGSGARSHGSQGPAC